MVVVWCNLSYVFHRWCLLLLACTVIVFTANVVVDATTTDATPPKRKFVAANWKCNVETIGEVDTLIKSVNQHYSSLNKMERDDIELCLLVPYVFIDRVRQRLHQDVLVGSQNVGEAAPIIAIDNQRYKTTGTITTNMLQSVGCDWVLLGHSDRRNSLHEKDTWIAEKVRLVLDSGHMGVIVTIGELQSQRRWGRTLSTLQHQLQIATQYVQPGEWGRIVVAYEPVWAIGDGAQPCSPDEAQRILSVLRSYIHQWAGPSAANDCRFTYTGSVDAENCASYSSLSDVDGFVVGRAGLDAAKLQRVVRSLTREK
jgi:triosephosphate isomerase